MKTIKCFLVSALALIVLIVPMSLTGYASADNILPHETTQVQEILEDGTMLYLISESVERVDEYTLETARIYSSINPNSETISGSGTFKYEKELEFSNEGSTPFKYWVKGTFTWNSSTHSVTVTNRIYDHDDVPANCRLENESKTHGNNQGTSILFGKKYAYLQYEFTFVNWAGFERSAKVYLKVDEEGSSSHK